MSENRISLKLLYLVRSEADFERIIALGIAGRDKYTQSFIYAGDISLSFENGIKNLFQKDLFKNEGFAIKNIWEYDLICRILRRFLGKPHVTYEDVINKRSSKLSLVRSTIFRKLISRRKATIVKKTFDMINPDVLITDQSQMMDDYYPEIIRRKALDRGIPVCLFPHGAGGGLHCHFSDPINHDGYEKYHVFVCSKGELPGRPNKHTILGDISTSFPYINYIHKKSQNQITFNDDKPFRLAFFIGGGPPTTTNAWSKMEQIIIDLSENDQVAMIIKSHPRDPHALNSSIVNHFNNVQIVGSECDHSRLVKWANIIVSSDHSSVVFEPMILGKKVVAIEGKHVPKFKEKHSPLINAKLLHIKSSSEFELNRIPNSDPEEPIINDLAWGGNGKKDLAVLFHEKMEQLIKGQESTKNHKE
jgi:hypothetical protein